MYMQRGSRASIEQSPAQTIKQADQRGNFHKTEASETSKIGSSGRQGNLVAVEEHTGLFSSQN
jgi:hypothetical protein